MSAPPIRPWYTKTSWRSMLFVFSLWTLWSLGHLGQQRYPLPPAVVAQAPASGASSPTPTTEILVDFQDDVSPSQLAGLEQQLGLHFHLNSPDTADSKLYLANVAPERQALVLEVLSHSPLVESAEPNVELQGYFNEADRKLLNHVWPLQKLDEASVARFKPDDPLYRYQWHLHKIGMEKAWTVSRGRGAVVAVIDTGVAYENHGSFIQVEDLKDTHFVPGYNYIAGNEHANDDQGHGTHVAGTIAQATNNGVGVAGVAPQASIMPLKVLNARGFGKVADIAAAIRFAANHGAKVINMSLGGPGKSKALESACNYAHNKGVTVVCAAGNSKSENVGYPAGYPVCIAVSATRYDDALTFYTNRGKRIDIAAPGGDMTVDQNEDGYKDGVLQNTILPGDPSQQTYALYQGTSMASPHVAGVAALLVSMGVTDPEAIRTVLTRTARKEGLGDLTIGYGSGVLDADAATQQVATTLPTQRLLIALLLVAAAFTVTSTRRPQLSPGLVLGLVAGSSGFYMLSGMLGVYSQWPVLGIFLHPVADWDLIFASPGQHANLLFWSALIPLAVTMATFGQETGQRWSLGLSLGTAAFLLHQLVWGTAGITLLPGVLLGKLWLLVNTLACFFLAYMLIQARPSETLPKGSHNKV